jgi:uncharacterized protein (TIGR00106 family)
MLAHVAIFPTDKGESVSAQVARIIDMIAESGLAYKVTAMGTQIEGEAAEVFALIQACHMEMRKGSKRVYTTIAIDDRDGATGRLTGKIASLEAKTGRSLL